MPPKRDPPPMDEALATLADAMAKLTTTSTENTENTEKLLSAQAASHSQLDIIIHQLATQFEQTATLITTLAKPTEKPSSSGSKNSLYDSTLRPPKLTLPNFDGSNPLDWIFQAEQYFTFYNISPTDRLPMVAFHLTGDALGWYKYLHHNHLLTTWESFTRALETRFGPSSYDNHQAALFKLRQTSTVTAYQTEFERLSNYIVGLPSEALLNCFLSGLRSDIQQELAILKPTSITQAIGLAKLIEDKTNESRSRPRYPSFPRTPTNTQQQISPPTTPTPALLPTPTTTPSPTKPNPTLSFTRLSPDAMQKRPVSHHCRQ